MAFQLLELLGKCVPFNVLLSTVNLHPYIKAESEAHQDKRDKIYDLEGKVDSLKDEAEALKVRRCRLTPR